MENGWGSTYRIGIDAGSKTIKLVVVDDAGEIVESLYRRHRSDLRTTLHEILHDFVWRYGDYRGFVAITGSAGIAAAQTLGLPFIQEVLATTHAVREIHPQADCVVELGGEDAKVIYLTGGVEQRMNATCAGGTGGFIETMAHLLGVRTSEIGRLSLGASRVYPIASRCAVFAQTDVRPLLNAGAKRADIAASALEAVVQQTLGGLACGRPLHGTVVFLGGPFEKVGTLAFRFRRALGLTNSTGIKPKDAHLYTARGAAMLATGQGAIRSLSELDAQLEGCPAFEDDLAHLPPLFESEADRSAFDARHSREGLERVKLDQARLPLFLGVDAGSTTLKYALVDADGKLVDSDYRKVDGDVLGVATDMLVDLQGSLAAGPYDGARDYPIARAVVTGYGEDLLKTALRIDAGIVETMAHMRAARWFKPDATFVLDIGGQDIKALWVRDGHLADVVLNEACSSGCGSFVEGAARSLRLNPYRFSAEALESKRPIDLGTKCTVFMTSRIRHAQKVGASRADIAAGAAYSVVRNAMDRIIGRNKSARMGSSIVVQGGAFKSDAVLRAFELVSGTEVVRPNEAHLMGAFGCALVAREQWECGGQAQTASTLLAHDELKALAPQRRTVQCAGCSNRCTVSIVDFGGRCSLSGNRCERAWGHVGLDVSADGRAERPPNAVRAQQTLRQQFGTCESAHARGALRVGVLDTLNMASDLPFWHTLARELGFSVVVGRPGAAETRARAAMSVPSESVCVPAKVSHARVYDLAEQGADVVFAPTFERGRHCPVARGYNEALVSNLPAELRERVRFSMPHIEALRLKKLRENERDKDVLFECFAQLARSYEPLTRDEFDAALAKAFDVQARSDSAEREVNDRALAWVHADITRHGIVLDGRTYHYDPEVLHRIDEVLTGLGVAVLSARNLELPAAPSTKPNVLWPQSKHLVRLMQRVFADPQLEVVSLRSFGCGYDAVSFDEARDYASACHRPFTELKIDEMVDVSHVRIRLRTLVELLESGVSTGCATVGDVAGWGEGEKPVLPAEQELRPARGLFGPIGSEELALARAHATGDLCFTAQALAARAARALERDPDAVLEVPYVCNGCVVDALPYEVGRMCGRVPRVVWTDADHLVRVERVSKRTSGGTPGARRVGLVETLPASDANTWSRTRRVGLVGNPLLVFDSYMNEGLEELLVELGCEVVYPDPHKLLVEDVRYEAQLGAFAEQGVDCVIYLQSFGCLKGHIQSRGAARWFKERYPDMPVTVIDYDPESSALNRENRIRLAVSA